MAGAQTHCAGQPIHADAAGQFAVDEVLDPLELSAREAAFHRGQGRAEQIAQKGQDERLNENRARGTALLHIRIDGPHQMFDDRRVMPTMSEIQRSERPLETALDEAGRDIGAESDAFALPFAPDPVGQKYRRGSRTSLFERSSIVSAESDFRTAEDDLQAGEFVIEYSLSLSLQRDIFDAIGYREARFMPGPGDGTPDEFAAPVGFHPPSRVGRHNCRDRIGARDPLR